MVQFFFVGPPKTGTTFIYEMLSKLSEVSVSQQTKELDFFNKNFKRGIKWYHDSFDYTRKIICDISTSYFTSELARVRIKEYNPAAKIIITIRNPLNRLISHYKHNIRFGIIDRIPIKDAIKFHPNMVENSMYAKYIHEWILDFGEENVMILPLELLKVKPDKFINQLEEFMGISLETVSGQVSEKINYASQPRSYTLARYVRILRREFNNLGMHFIVRFFKKLGLKKILYEGGENIMVEKLDQEDLKHLFKSDLAELNKYNIPLEILENYSL